MGPQTRGSARILGSVHGNCGVGEISTGSLGDEAFPGQGKNRDEEMAELKRKLAKAEQERDFLKDAAVFFAKESK